LKLNLIDPDSLGPGEADRFGDRTVFQTRPWLDFLADSQGAAPVVAEVRGGEGRLGYFTGAVVRKFGLRILGSPFPGWTTSYMGFNLPPEVPRREALKALEAFAFRELRCVHVEVMDYHLSAQDGEALGFSRRMLKGFQSDLTLTEEELFARMTSACRRCIRKSEKEGVVIEEAHDESFAAEYYDQLLDVFGKQGLKPTYDQDRVSKLIKHLGPAGLVLQLRARNAEGRCIATGLYPGSHEHSFFWGNASYRSDQGVRPNEPLHWYAMRYWKQRGALRHDWGGGGDYKAKYGGTPIAIPWFSKSRSRVISRARTAAYDLYKTRRTLMRFLSRGKQNSVAGG
jgi:hypothetical protein